MISFVQGMSGEGLSSDINSLRINERGEEFGFDATIYPGDIKEGLKALGGNNQAVAKEIIDEQEEIEVMELKEIENEAILEHKTGLPQNQKVPRNCKLEI